MLLLVALIQVVTPVSQKASADTSPDLSTEAGALAEAKASGKEVEVTGLRSETRDVVARPDGLLEGVEHLRPVRTMKDGKWVGVDPTLHRSDDGSIAPAASTVGLTFSGGGSGPLVKMTRAGRQMTLTWPSALPKPTLDGETATYPEVLPGVDLQVRADVDGFGQVLIVKTPEAAADPRVAQIKLGMDSGGLTVTQGPDKTLKAIDKGTGGTVFAAPAPRMWDSGQTDTPETPPSESPSPSPSATSSVAPKLRSETSPTTSPTASPSPAPTQTGGPSLAGGDASEGAPDGAKQAPVGVTVDNSSLTLTPDKSLLTASDTNFPVYIDPWFQGTPLSTDSGGEWGMVGSEQVQYKFSSNEGVGFCDYSFDPKCQRDQVKRIWYRFPIGKYIGKDISSAYFTANETAASQCPSTTARRINLYRPKAGTGFNSSSTWNSTNDSDHFNTLLSYRNATLCSGLPAPIKFDNSDDENSTSKTTSYLKERLNGKINTILFALKAGSESDMMYTKRLATKAELHITYNTRPNKPTLSQMNMVNGGGCTNPDGSLHNTRTQPAMVSELPRVHVRNVSDPDASQGDMVRVQFGLSWDAGDGTGWKSRWVSNYTGYMRSGANDFGWSLSQPSPPVTIPQDTLIGWHVIANDGKSSSAWSWQNGSDDCYFKYDLSAPKVTIASTDYPMFDPEKGVDAPYGNVGQYGVFTAKIDANGTGVSQVSWDINHDSRNGGTAPVVNGIATINAMPVKAGVNDLNVTVTNNYGKRVDATYPFRVMTGSDPKAYWTANEEEGSSALADSGSEDPKAPLSLNGGVTTGAPGKVGKAATFNGSDGYGQTSGQVVDTTKSFSLSAWVRLTDKALYRAVISQAGGSTNGLLMSYSPVKDRWTWILHHPDGTDDAIASDQAPVAGQWTHLTGVYDVVTKQMALYVNGLRQQGTATHQPWAATGPLYVGTGWTPASLAAKWRGDLDDIRLYDRPLGYGEVSLLATARQQITGRWRLNTATGSPLASPNEVIGGAPLTLAGQANMVTGVPLFDDSVSPLPAADRTSPVGSLSLNEQSGTDGTATTSQTLDGSHSFTVSAWVWAAAEPTRAMTAFSLAGANGDGLTVHYLPGAVGEVKGGVWEAALTGRKTGIPTSSTNLAHFYGWNPFPDHGDRWQLITVVYDAAQKRLTLYVNSQEQDTSDDDTTDDGSIVELVDGFTGSAPVRLGRNMSGGEPWSGRVDDVWTVDGALSPDQVGWLYGMTTELDADQMTN
ncbi:LamG domain-containing protein [Actinomadura oligospora]|uniref:LamG domain-containing protein n=1 Tax=Actinomadura oligospora TaxID=111804 RepID=UPI000479FBD3|nr:LamG domain-containing protein [Actinomadura oligospora]